MNMGPKPPADLDREGRRKWAELVDAVDPDDYEILANYARQHSTLLAIGAEKAKLIKAGTFSTMVPGRDKALQLNPLLTAESRLVSSLNRQLRGLGLSPSREEQDRRSKKPASGPPPPGFSGPEPVYGWEVEIALCKGKPDPTPEEIEGDRLRDAWVAARRNQGGMHGPTRKG
jgi:phage terminase small subunit